MPNKRTVALVGQPNSGKTSLFNALTGSNQYVGNWPGVTIEKKEGRFNSHDIEFLVVDLPGCYSLNPYSLDERITKDYLRNQKPDFIINVVDSTHLERHLYLTLQLISLKIPMIFALNMTDELENLGLSIDEKAFSEILGVPVVSIIARENKGIEPLVSIMAQGVAPPIPQEKVPVKPKEIYLSTKRIIKKVIRHTLKKQNKTAVWLNRIDYFALHPTFGPILFFLLMFLGLEFTFLFGGIVISWFEKGLGFLYQYFEIVNNPITKSVLQHGILSGVGNVVLLVPYIALLFFFISFLEDSGYMGRAAYVMDRFMHKLGLHGKSFIPLLLGFGCNVPAIMTTRSLETDGERIKTILMIPFMSCSGRLPVFVLFAGAFFGSKGVLIVIFLYILGILSAILTALLLKKTVIREESPDLLMELPPYRFPFWRNIWKNTWLKVKQYFYKAGTLIFIVTIFLWFLSYFPSSSGFGGEKSLIGIIGKWCSPFLKPLGFDWRMTIALISGFIAKELVLSSLGVLYPGGSSLSTTLQQVMDSKTAFVFLIFILLYIPCIATIAVIRSETNWKWATFSVIWSIMLAWIVSFLFRFALQLV